MGCQNRLCWVILDCCKLRKTGYTAMLMMMMIMRVDWSAAFHGFIATPLDIRAPVFRDVDLLHFIWCFLYVNGNKLGLFKAVTALLFLLFSVSFLNQEAYRLSKQALLGHTGLLQVEEQRVGAIPPPPLSVLSHIFHILFLWAFL